MKYFTNVILKAEISEIESDHLVEFNFELLTRFNVRIQTQIICASLICRQNQASTYSVFGLTIS